MEVNFAPLSPPDAGALVAEDRRKQPLGIGPGQRIGVGVTDPGGLDLDHSTSPVFGPSSRTVSIDRGVPAWWATAARVSITVSPVANPQPAD
jgi:hypothetical protein